MLTHDATVFLLQLVLCFVALKVLSWIGTQSSSLQRHSRKLMHIATGIIHLAFWPLYSSGSVFTAASSPEWWSAAVPGIITAYVAMLGAGVGPSDATVVRAMSRSGNRSDLLKGPLVYGVVHVLVTLQFWRTRMAHMIILTLCCGDGFAAVIGREFGRGSPLPWNSHKSWHGSLAFVGATMGGVWAFYALVLHQNVTSFFLLQQVGVVAVLAALVESLPIDDWDNATVPVATWAAVTYVVPSLAT